MISENLQRRLKKGGVVLSLMFGLLLMSGVTVKAQYRNDDDYYRQQRRQQERERREEERRDRDRDGDRDYRNNGGYYPNNGGNYPNNGGYYPNNGGNYPNNGRYGNDYYRMAQQYGYQDGVNKGMEDAREGHYNPQGTSLYKNALNGYNGGNKDAYRQAYRQAFLQGFDEGYNRNNRYRNNRYPNGSSNPIRRIILGY